MVTRIVPATDFHADWVGAFARTQDVDELWASGRQTPEQAITRGLATSTLTWAGEIDGEPVMVAGVCPASLLTGIGCPWMVTTDRVYAAQKTLLLASRGVVAQMHRQYSWLVNFVDDRNVRAHRWLEWLGFTLHDPEPHGPDGLLFRKFEWRQAPTCVVR